MSSESLEPRIVPYDTKVFPFREIVSRQLEVPDLARVHEGAHYELRKRENDQKTAFHQKFYAIGEKFYDTYRRFLKDVVQPIFNGEALVYQKIPTFRVHLPDNIAVGEFHHDSKYNHGPDEINFWLPVTDAWDTNTIQVESAPGKEDYHPLNVRYGEVMIFNGVLLKHGNVLNRTGSTRVSFDFRVMPHSKYKPREDAASVNMGVKFVIGGYFDLLPAAKAV